MFREPRSSFPQWFASDKIEVKESDIHGLGCFATEDIGSRMLIESCPVIIFPVNSLEVLNQRGGRHILTEYPYNWIAGEEAICLGYGSLYNHSTNSPNVTWKFNESLPAIEFYSISPIKAGEEILVRYIPYRLKDRIWFVDDDSHDGAYFSLEDIRAADRLNKMRSKK